ncbi:hypothetical protein EXU48_13930 [Occultella glacieicola]|uniref:Uncharacterized protein n=1 Tax=Occultella glacieicola TaxID=2518684 RepID=A0ABY2E5E8_9MICO|nr:hypothetical protein [Occultella glacieicola]TDE92632.1 hypothetical protein EXU48_13930 [Occultella glacieicola]
MDTASVIIAGGPAARDVRSLVAVWAKQGITGASLWVDPVDVIEAPPAPVHVSAVLVDRDGEHRVDLFAHLGRYRLDLVRVVAVQFAVTADAVSTELTDLGQEIGVTIERALPRDPSGRVMTRLHRSILVIPASGVHGLPGEILAPGWEANVVISPEDRPDLDRMSIYVRAAENYAGHAAAAVSVAAGILRGVPGGAFDKVTTDSSANPEDVVVARVSIRSVVGEGVVDVLARKALDPAGLGPQGPGRVVAWAAPASEPDLIARRAAQTVLEAPEWVAQTPPAGDAPERTREGLRRALGRAARFNLRTVGAVAAWTANSGRTSLERSATEHLVGHGSGVLVTVGPRAVDDAEAVARDAIDAARRTMDDEIAYEATRGAPPPANTWIRLRDLAFALADGGPIPGMESPTQTGVREVLRPGDVVPAPGTVFRTRDGRRLDALAVQDLRSHRLDLARDREVREGEVIRLQEARALAVAERADAQAPPPAAGEPAPSGGDADAAGEDARLAAAIADAERAVREARAVEAEFARWHAQHSRSVMSRVGEDVARRLDEVEASRQRFLDRRDDVTAPATAALDRAKERLLRQWRWTLAIAAVVIAVVWVWATQADPEPDWSVYAWLTGGVVILAVVALVGFNHAFYKAFRHYEWEVANVLARQRRDAAAFLWEGKQLARLRLLLAGWRSWATVIAEVIHRPWEPAEAVYEDLTDDVIERFPAAMAVARQEEEQVDIGTRLLVAAYRAVYTEGWAQQAFAEAYEAFAARVPGGQERGHLDVDTDVSGSELGARGQLVEFWGSGQARGYLGQERTRRLRQLSNDGELDLPHRRVGRVGKYSDDVWQEEPAFFLPTTVSETTFAQEMFTSTARAADRHYVHTARLWLPQVAYPAAERITPNDRVGPTVSLRPADADTALRVDLSPRLLRREVALFAPKEPTGRRAAVDRADRPTGLHAVETTTDREFL